MPRHRTVLASLSLGYVVVLTAALISWFLLPRNDEPQLPGCYWVRLWGMSIKCIEFIGHDLVEHILNMPRAMVELPTMGAIVLFTASRNALDGLLLLGWGALYWAPIAFLAWRVIAGRKSPANHGVTSAI